MTRTNCDLFTHKSSRSYLNHLVCVCVYVYIYIHTHTHTQTGITDILKITYVTDRQTDRQRHTYTHTHTELRVKILKTIFTYNGKTDNFKITQGMPDHGA
jgi:hypothetical protein